MLEVQIEGLTAKRDVDLRSASYEAKEVFVSSYIGYLAHWKRNEREKSLNSIVRFTSKEIITSIDLMKEIMDNVKSKIKLWKVQLTSHICL